MNEFRLPPPAKYYNLRQAPVILPSVKGSNVNDNGGRMPLDREKELQKEKEILQKYFNKGRQELDDSSWRSPS